MNKKIALNVMELAYSNMSEGSNVLQFSQIRTSINNGKLDDVIDAFVSMMEEPMEEDGQLVSLFFQETLWFIKVLNEFKLDDYSMLERFVLHTYDPSIPTTERISNKVSTGQSVQRITNEIFNSISHQ
jgi:hypothetical protein